jgi:hypothetical protein
MHRRERCPLRAGSSRVGLTRTPPPNPAAHKPLGERRAGQPQPPPDDGTPEQSNWETTPRSLPRCLGGEQPVRITRTRVPAQQTAVACGRYRTGCRPRSKRRFDRTSERSPLPLSGVGFRFHPAFELPGRSCGESGACCVRRRHVIERGIRRDNETDIGLLRPRRRGISGNSQVRVAISPPSGASSKKQVGTSSRGLHRDKPLRHGCARQRGCGRLPSGGRQHDRGDDDRPAWR